MIFVEKQREAKEALARCRNAAERLTWLVTRADLRPRLDPVHRTDSNLVPGCLSKLWLVCGLARGRCTFACDSDSRVVRAVASLLCELATDCTPAEVVAAGSLGAAGLGLEHLLAPNRRAAQTQVWQRIVTFAAAQLNHPDRL